MIAYKDYARKCRERHIFPLTENEFDWEVEQLSIAPENDGLVGNDLDAVILSALLNEQDDLVIDDDEEDDDGPGVMKFNERRSSD